MVQAEVGDFKNSENETDFEKDNWLDAMGDEIQLLV